MVLRRRILELSQYVDIDPSKMYKYIVDNCLETTDKKFYYKSKIDLSYKTIKHTNSKWIKFVDLNFKAASKIFNDLYKVDTINVSIGVGIANEQLKDLFSVNFINNSNSFEISTFSSDIESIGIEIGRLQSLMNNPSISQEKASRLYAQIVKLFQDLEDLKRKQRNKPKI